MPETLIEAIISKKINSESVVKWLNGERSDDVDKISDSINCSKGEFVLNFLTYIRNQTERFLKNNNNESQILQNHQTPEKLLQAHKTPLSADSATTGSSVKRHKRSKVKLFHESSINKEVFEERLPISSTPVKSDVKLSSPLSGGHVKLDTITSPNLISVNRSTKTSSYFETPKASKSISRISSSEKSYSLGDFITNSSKVVNKKKKLKNISNDSTDETTDSSKLDHHLDITSSESFPEIGAKRPPSRSKHSVETRRIKPTNLSENFSLVNRTFPTTHLNNNVRFADDSVNEDSKLNFDMERNILKMERDKIIEKFASNNHKLTITQAKSVREESKDSLPSIIEASYKMVTNKKCLDILVLIYNAIIDNNLLISVNSELYFVLSLILSKQLETDFNQIMNEVNSENISENLLKIIHNSTYFAINTVWKQRELVKLMLDKISLKLLSENLLIKDYSMELSEFLLEAYCVKCEHSGRKDFEAAETNFVDGNVCFNFETDNLENFPSATSFQHFKKQRDVFYEILRWWTEDCEQLSLRSKIRALLNLSVSPTNHKHLARLFQAHLIQECGSTQQESKLSKLQRRLISAPQNNSAESAKSTKFIGREVFYRDFIVCSESEAFRAHLKDELASELCQTDAQYQPNCEYETNESTHDLKQEYYKTIKKLRLLAKFFGLLVAMPYSATYGDYTPKTSIGGAFSANKDICLMEKVLENDVFIRNHTQPLIDLMATIKSSLESSRLMITVPWLCQYLSMLDPATLRTRYYKKLIQALFEIYTSLATLSSKNTQHLRLCLSCLFDAPHFPQEMFYNLGETYISTKSLERVELGVDCLALVDELALQEICPFVKEINSLVVSSNCIAAAKNYSSSFRHITPVTMPVDPVDRIKLKENELQAKLEESLIKSQPSSTRRVLDIVSERVSSATVKYLTSHLLADYRRKAKSSAIKAVKEWRKHTSRDETLLLRSLQKSYTQLLCELRSEAETYSVRSSRDRCVACVEALLPHAVSKPLAAVTARAAVKRTRKWLLENWQSSAILCKDIESEMNNLLIIGDLVTVSQTADARRLTDERLLTDDFDAVNVSAADVLMALREALCILLIDNRRIDKLLEILEKTAKCCNNNNVFITASSKKCIFQLTVDLLVVFVSKHPNSVDAIHLKAFDKIFNECCYDRPRNINGRVSPPLPERRNLSPIPRNMEDLIESTPETSDDETASCQKAVTSPCQKNDDINSQMSRIALATPERNLVRQSQDKMDDTLADYFSRIVCARNLMILASGGPLVWRKFAEVLIFLARRDYVSVASLSEQVLALFRQEWPQNILENLSQCMKYLADEFSDLGKDALFIDFISDFCANLEFDSDESFI